MDHCKPVVDGSVWLPEYGCAVQTSCGCSCTLLGSKNQTELDFKTLSVTTMTKIFVTNVTTSSQMAQTITTLLQYLDLCYSSDLPEQPIIIAKYLHKQKKQGVWDTPFNYFWYACKMVVVVDKRCHACRHVIRWSQIYLLIVTSHMNNDGGESH